MNLDTPMMQQYLAIKEKTDAILFFRMGDFYEMFLDDAYDASAILEITLTKRNGVPMCGIPYHAKDAYLYKLLKNGKRVAICEQVEDPKLTKKIVKREIVEIITPGTLINNEIIDADNPNYIASFYLGDDFFASSHCDVSTGDVFYCSEQKLENRIKAFEFLRNELYKIRPKEIIYPETFSEDKFLDILKTEHQKAIFYSVPDFYYSDEYATKILTDELSVSTLKGFGVKEKTFETGVIGALVKYIKDVQLKEIDYIKSIVKLSRNDRLDLPATAIRNLELLNNLYDGSVKHSLFSVLNSCKTSMGSRLLYEWIKRPLSDVKEISNRHDIVEFFTCDKETLNISRDILKTIGDIERISTKIFFQKANP
jgi:DNA mismatch repair protein MutS